MYKFRVVDPDFDNWRKNKHFGINTIGVKHTKGEFRESHLEEIIENILEIAEYEVAGFSVMCKFRFTIKESTLGRYKEICENYVGQ